MPLTEQIISLRSILVLLAVAAFAFSACTKWDLKKKEDKITGNWAVAEALVDEKVDTFAFFGWRYSLDESGKMTLTYLSDSLLTETLTGEWSLTHNGDVVQLALTGDIQGVPYDETIFWKILRLTNTQFWVEYDNGVKEYEIRMVPF